MELIRMSEAPTFTTPAGFTARTLLDNQAFTVVNLILKPGETVEKHTTPVDLFFYVIRGSGKIQVEDEEATVVQTDIVFSPKNTSRGLQASPVEELHVLVVRNPISNG